MNFTPDMILMVDAAMDLLDFFGFTVSPTQAYRTAKLNMLIDRAFDMLEQMFDASDDEKADLFAVIINKLCELVRTASARQRRGQ